MNTRDNQGDGHIETVDEIARAVMGPTKIRKNRHPLLRHRRAGQWYPDAVGKVRGYPRTQEIYDAQVERCRTNRQRASDRGRLTRTGVPNGWAGRKHEIAEAGRNSRTEAEALVEKVFEPDNYESRLCMREALAIVLNPTVHVSDKLTAMRMIWSFVQAEPMDEAMARADPLEGLRQLVALRAPARK